ncbi:MAG TPA: EamA family transporter, partial [Candidatus Dormibacteraeota bacterium]|nr:EamA family transporter [Candidatus Dormibacteraeota bacterium]
MLSSFVFVALYIGLIGVASVIEVPVGRGLSAFQMNFLIRVGSMVAAVVAVIAVHHASAPSAAYVVAGLGIGIVTGGGSILYCFGLKYMAVSLVVTLSNLYLVITAALGVVLLSEPVTLLKIVGFLATLIGVVVLSHTPARYGVTHPGGGGKRGPPKRAYVIMAVYVVVV